MIKEIKAAELDTAQFIDERVKEIREAVGSDAAINALSGGVDSSTVTMLGHRALGAQLRTVFVENGLMRAGEPQMVAETFRKLGVTVEIVDAREEFLAALRGITDPEEKREAITQTFYKKVFGRIVRESKARHLLQGTILTDVDETVAGIKRQHNVFSQLGIDPKEAFGYQIIEPLVQLRKEAVRKLGEALGLPGEMFDRIPFPGREARDRAKGHSGGGAHFKKQQGLSIHGHPSQRPGDRRKGRQAGFRPPDRDPLLGQHRRAHRHPHKVAIRNARQACGRHHQRGARGRKRHLQHLHEAALNDRGYMSE